MTITRRGFLSASAAVAAAPLLGLLGAAVFGFFAVQLSGVYFAMLTLAFAQIVWSIASSMSFWFVLQNTKRVACRSTPSGDLPISWNR